MRNSGTAILSRPVRKGQFTYHIFQKALVTSDHQLNRAQEKVSFFAPFFMAPYWKAMKKWAEENDAFSCVTFCMRLLR